MSRKSIVDSWQKKVFLRVVKLAGKRYTPAFYTKIRELYGEIRKQYNSFYPSNKPELLGLELTNFDYCFIELLDLLTPIKEYSNIKIPWVEISKCIEKLDDIRWKLESKISNVQNSQENEKKESHESKIFSSVSYNLRELQRSTNKMS